MSKVPTKLKLAKILRQMPLGDVNMSALDRPLQDRPEPFNGIRVVAVARPFLFRVVDRAVNVAIFRQFLISVPFVRADSRALGDVLGDVRFNRRARHIGDHARDDLAATLDKAEHQRLAKSATAPAPLAVAAHHRFVCLDVARKLVVAVHNRQILADFVAHAPRRLVVHAQLALQFLGRHAVARRGEQIHRIEPLLQRRMRAMKRRSGHGVQMFTALAGVSGLLCELAEFAPLAAARAFAVRAKARLEQIVQAGVVIWKQRHELGDGHRLGHGVTFPSLPRNLA